ncbi:hypothetical protein COOONC_17265 [Cooperia oncophora]
MQCDEQHGSNTQLMWMEEAREELDAAILQAKKHCISIQQNVWNNEKLNLRPLEDLYVRRYIYGVTVARKSRFFNGQLSNSERLHLIEDNYEKLNSEKIGQGDQ